MTLLIAGFAILTIVGVVACGIFAYYFGQLNSRLQSLENAINKLEKRDEKVAISLDSISEMKGEMGVYKQLIDENRKTVSSQRQYIAKLLQRTESQGQTINQVVKVLRENDINFNVTLDKSSTHNQKVSGQTVQANQGGNLQADQDNA